MFESGSLDERLLLPRPLPLGIRAKLGPELAYLAGLVCDAAVADRRVALRAEPTGGQMHRAEEAREVRRFGDLHVVLREVLDQVPGSMSTRSATRTFSPRAIEKRTSSVGFRFPRSTSAK